ncbi:MAG: hypothetical protein OEV95_00020 [Gemmatimonadota bacterium]|nr:hypothetical protein [Gemmatimonadota bacterium]MDH5282682.1 hypothetical protein [Gemmatimonadota bacterium]
MVFPLPEWAATSTVPQSMRRSCLPALDEALQGPSFMRRHQYVDMVVHHCHGDQVEMDPIVPSDHVKDSLAFDMAQHWLIALQTPRHEVRRSLDPPMWQPSAIDAEGHAARLPQYAGARGPRERGIVRNTADGSVAGLADWLGAEL